MLSYGRDGLAKCPLIGRQQYKIAQVHKYNDFRYNLIHNGGNPCY